MAITTYITNPVEWIELYFFLGTTSVAFVVFIAAAWASNFGLFYQQNYSSHGKYVSGFHRFVFVVVLAAVLELYGGGVFIVFREAIRQVAAGYFSLPAPVNPLEPTTVKFWWIAFIYIVLIPVVSLAGPAFFYAHAHITTVGITVIFTAGLVTSAVFGYQIHLTAGILFIIASALSLYLIWVAVMFARASGHLYNLIRDPLAFVHYGIHKLFLAQGQALASREEYAVAPRAAPGFASEATPMVASQAAAPMSPAYAQAAAPMTPAVANSPGRRNAKPGFDY